MRHDIVRKAEKHTIKQFLTRVISGIGFDQHDVSPLPAMAQFACPAKHPFRQIDTINPALGSDSLSEIGKIPAGPTAHFEDSIAPSKFQLTHCTLAETRWNEKCPFENWNECSKTIVALADNIVIANRPLANCLARQLIDFASVQECRQVRTW